MRRTISLFVCVLMAGFYAGLNAQIPENPRFQPGSYALLPGSYAVPAPALPAVTEAEGAETEDVRTEWEKRFSPQIAAPMVAQPLPPPVEVPYLTFTYNHWTGRFHVVPYEPGYAANPAAFPHQTSPLHIWISSKSSAAQPSPQVQYMSYYDPDPVILPAEIQLRGTRFSAPFTQLQPMPLPVPQPEGAQLAYPPPRNRLGERIRQAFGTFVAQ